MKFEELKKIYLFSLSHLVNKALVNPDYIGILLTKRCNLKCKMCHIYKHPTSVESELTFSEIKRIVSDVAMWGVKTITLTGGEPFLRKDFFEIAEYTMSKVGHTAINTNLTLINREIAEKICDLPYHKFHLEVSLDGAYPETHDYIRGTSGAFNKIIEGIRLIREVSKEKNTDVHIGTTFVLMEENVREVMDFVRMAANLKFVNVSIMPMLISNVDLKKRGNKPYMEPESLVILDKVIDELIDYKRKNPLIINPIESIKLYKQYFRANLTINGLCNAGYMGPNIVEDGKTFICTHFIGNIKQRDIKEIWYSNMANQVRRITEKCSKPCLQHYAIRFQEQSPFLATYNFFKEKIKWIKN